MFFFFFRGMHFFFIFTFWFIFLTFVENERTDFPVAKCSVVSQQFNASAQIFLTDLIPAFEVSNLTFALTSLETNILKQLNKLQTRLTNLEETIIRQKKIDYTEASEHIEYRKVEIQTFNSTIHVEKSGINMFTYYWKLRGIKNILKNERTRSIRSQSFYVYSNGYRMYLKFLPKFNSDLFNIQTGITKGDFDNQLLWPFSLKYRISVLDQDPVDQVEDMVSKIWNPEYVCKKTFWMKPINDNHGCIVLSFTEEMFLSKNYVRNDSAVIKLTVYLN